MDVSHTMRGIVDSPNPGPVAHLQRVQNLRTCQRAWSVLLILEAVILRTLKIGVFLCSLSVTTAPSRTN